MHSAQINKRSSFIARLERALFENGLSLATKFNLLSIALILITAAGICLFMIRMEMTNNYRELLSHGKTIADTTARNCEFGMYTENRSLLLPVLESLSADSEIAYVSVMNRKRAVLASRVFIGKSKQLPNHSILIDESSAAIQHADFIDAQDGRKYTEILCPLMSEGHNGITDVLLRSEAVSPESSVIGYVRLGLTHEVLQKRIQQMLISVIVFTIALVLIGMALTVLLTRKITSPLKRLTQATQSIAEGRFDVPFNIRSGDEIVELARSFDHMRDRLNAYHAQVEERLADEQRHLVEKEQLMMDLHDGIGGITTNIRILSELALKTNDEENIRKTLATISQLSRDGVSEIRSFMQGLDSTELSWRTLAVELRSQGTTLLEAHRIRFDADISVEDVSEQPGSLVWVNVLKIFKEALTNIVKHSRAGNVAITFTVGTHGILLSVQDDGIGLSEQLSSGRGMPSMKKRAEELGGSLTMSGMEKGVRISLDIPFPLRYNTARKGP
jgi:signal transduction histidine kinase